jgi:hypothetical protein
MSRRLVPISDLAAFAADPDGYRARNGAPASARAAEFGTAYHASFARARRVRPIVRRLVVVALCVVVLALLYLALRR